jgi:hypothetical protein
MAVTLASARRAIAARASEFLQGTATSGSTTTLIDTNNLQYVDSYWNEQTVLFTSGTNNGLQRKISAYTSATSQATLYTAASAAVVSGDTYELYRRFSPADHKTAINGAINKSWPLFYERAFYSITPTQDTLTYAWPSGLDLGSQGFMKLEYQAHTLPTQTTFPYQTLGTDMYDITEKWNASLGISQKTLQLRFNPESNRLLRMTFGTPLRAVSADADVISLADPETEWLYAKSIEELWRLEANRSESVARKDAKEQLATAMAEANRLERILGNPPDPAPLRRTRFYVSGY